MVRPAIAGLVVGVLLALPAGSRGAAPAPAAPLDSARQAESLPTPDVVRAMAREAYVWGWPLAYVHGCRVRVALVPGAGRSGGLPVAPVNELAMLTEQVAPRTTLVPCPNRDVLYGFGIFDLAATPVIVQVPDFGERFWLYQLGDQRTDGFAHLGSMYGTRPGCYLVVGPGWAGEIPPGVVDVLRSPTRHAYCIPRIFFTAAAGDRDAAAAAASGVMAYPLADYCGVPRRRDWTQLRWLPSLSRDQGAVTPGRFLEILPELLEDVPPLPGEEPLYERLHRLVEAVTADPALAAVATDAVHEAEREVVAPLFEFRNVGVPLPAGWTTVVNGAAFGTDYLTRTAVARSNVFVNRHHETKYYYLDVDVTGRRLAGDRRYTIRFPPGRLPPAAGFWSLTAYDARHSLPPVSAARHSIGTRDLALALADDGSLTIVIEPTVDPAAAGSTVAGHTGRNQITAPEGPFSLYLRLYAPLPVALDGVWTPPPVEPSYVTAAQFSSRVTTRQRGDRGGQTR
jgi:hypothetical protein